MRFGTSSLITVVCLMAGVTFAACSDDSENPGGGGAGGETASSTTSGPGSTSSATSTSSSTTGGGNGGSDGIGGEGNGGNGNGGNGNGGEGTGGTGGGSVCERACTRAQEECNSNFCEDNDVDCSTPQFDCIAQCVLEAESCDALNGNDPTLALCVLACAEDTGAGGGGNSTDCRVCSFQNGCLNECGRNAGCLAWISCTQTCFAEDAGPECFSACDDEASAKGEQVEALYREAYACTCTNCEAACGAIADQCSDGTN